MIPSTWDAADAAALALELRQATRAAGPIRRAVAALTAALIVQARREIAASPDGTLSPQAQQKLREAFAAYQAQLAVDAAAAVSGAIAAGIRLAIRQEAPELRRLGYEAPKLAAVLDRVADDPVLRRAPDLAQRSLEDALERIAEFGRQAPLRTETQVRNLAARAASAAATVERDVRTSTNRAVNVATLHIAAAAEPEPAAAAPSMPTPERTPLEPGRIPPTSGPAPAAVRLSMEPTVLVPPGLNVVWVAERQACLTCLALSGRVVDPNAGGGFDEFATFSPHGAPQVWPPGHPLMSPPRHPHCRCRLRIIAASNVLLPAALQREAQRSVARGWSDHHSRPARLRAADRMLAHAALPRTVVARARSDVARGAFSTRHKPRAAHLRAD